MLVFQSRGRDLLIGNCALGVAFVALAKFQSRGRDLLIGKTTPPVSDPNKHVSVPWSGFINRKFNQGVV